MRKAVLGKRSQGLTTRGALKLKGDSLRHVVSCRRLALSVWLKQASLTTQNLENVEIPSIFLYFTTKLCPPSAAGPPKIELSSDLAKEAEISRNGSLPSRN